jgi:hypothetical protein
VSDPVDVAQRLSAYEDGVRGFLNSTVTGITGADEPEVQLTSCTTGEGQSVHATVLLPLWDQPDATNDSVEAAFSAITTAWKRAGLSPSDRAMGTDNWTRSDTATEPVGVEQASIRGTKDGITVRVASPCVQ